MRLDDYEQVLAGAIERAALDPQGQGHEVPIRLLPAERVMLDAILVAVHEVVWPRGSQVPDAAALLSAKLGHQPGETAEVGSGSG